MALFERDSLVGVTRYLPNYCQKDLVPKPSREFIGLNEWKISQKNIWIKRHCDSRFIKISCLESRQKVFMRSCRAQQSILLASLNGLGGASKMLRSAWPFEDLLNSFRKCVPPDSVSLLYFLSIPAKILQPDQQINSYWLGRHLQKMGRCYGDKPIDRKLFWNWSAMWRRTTGVCPWKRKRPFPLGKRPFR